MTTGAIPTWRTELVEVGPKAYAYTQHPGTAGISNAGLVVGEEWALVVDAMLVPSMTRPFLEQVRRVTSLPIHLLVNTHHHGDHVFGNQFVGAQHVIGHPYCREEMLRSGPASLENNKRTRPQYADDWRQIEITAPDVTFEEKMVLHVGDTTVELLYLGGPAHTYGDVVVYLPQHQLLFAGDLAFYYITPTAHDGHVSGWIRVIDRIQEMAIETIVPGHGPVGDRRELAQVREYLTLIRRQARRCFRAGMSLEEAARTVRIPKYGGWGEQGWVARNVGRLYQEFRGEI
ncbi:MAG: MBL fold metallo-hydrolase [Dehalococcoidia bacterium]